MNTYKYTAKDKNSHAAIGMLEAASEIEAADILHRKELIVVSLESVKSRAPKTRGGRIGLEDLVIFTRQLSTMIDSGVPLVQSLGILGEQIENKRLKDVVVSVRQDIEAGTSFYDALAKYPSVFSELFINMAKAGEASGTLNEVLDRLAVYLEKAAALTRKIKSAMVYPAILISMAILITAGLLIKVVPIFKEIFASFGGELPLPTRILIETSNLLGRYFLFIVALFIILGLLFKKYIATRKGRYYFDSWKLNMPVFGPLFQKVALAKLTRTFATLVKSGISILNALDIVGKSSGNKVIEEAIFDCRSAVREGELISRNLAKSKVFPIMVTRMIGVGEQTGQLEKMLSKIADFYDEQVDAAVTAITSTIEPIVISFLGIVIGGIVVSLFLPIFSITELISQ
ncbi:MAG: type II secretion system F family protein [Candidatus Omnitrophota bacterium]|jgi:type IV pilus assembly protein PilC